jgi:Asp-tRNA(Asn)/Glu-tRNA(Gln) amidotransferase A subunit family amidase
MGNKTNYPQIREEAITRRNAQIDKHTPALQRILTDSRFTTSEQERITRLTLTALVSSLNKHEVTSLQLVAIFGLRAATIGKALCIITEDYFEYALARAEECDNIRRKSGKNNWTLEDEWDMDKFLPPLFGVPISLKDNIELAGTTSTVGLTARANRIIQEDDILAKAIKNAGMIPFVKTNLPQLAMCFDTNNFLWGRALNPWNQKKSVGGSSGG